MTFGGGMCPTSRVDGRGWLQGSVFLPLGFFRHQTGTEDEAFPGSPDGLLGTRGVSWVGEVVVQ